MPRSSMRKRQLAMGAVGTPHLTFVNQMETRWVLMNQERYDWGRATCSSPTTPTMAVAT